MVRSSKISSVKQVFMKTLLFILFSTFWVTLQSQSQSKGYVLLMEDGTIQIPDNAISINKISSLQAALDAKQAALISGTHIKTINGNSIVGSGNLVIQGGGEAFPVGSVFISVVSTNPNTLLGYGTWEAFGAGKVLIGFNSGDADFDAGEKTGGSKTVTIAAANLPQLSVAITDPGHTHVQNKNTATNGGLSGTTPDASTNTSAPSGYSTEPATTGITATANTGGANNAINIMNPFIVCFFWKRTN